MRTEADIPKIVKINVKNPPIYDVYIGRTNTHLNLSQSKWHNPFVMKRESERPECIKLHMEYFESNVTLLKSLDELSGKIMGCYCTTWKFGDKITKRCHGHNIIEMYIKIILNKNIKLL